MWENLTDAQRRHVATSLSKYIYLTRFNIRMLCNGGSPTTLTVISPSGSSAKGRSTSLVPNVISSSRICAVNVCSLGSSDGAARGTIISVVGSARLGLEVFVTAVSFDGTTPA